MSALSILLESAIRRAEEATPGPWRVKWDTEYGDFGAPIQGELRGVEAAYKRTKDGKWEFVRWVVRFDDDYGHDVAPDAAHIASLSPDVAIALYRCALVLYAAARNDCGCPWEQDEVGDGGYTEHGKDCLFVSLDALSQVMDR